MAAHVLRGRAVSAGFIPEATLADDGATPRFDFGDATLLETSGEEDADGAPSPSPAANLPLPSAALVLGAAFALGWRDRHLADLERCVRRRRSVARS